MIRLAVRAPAEGAEPVLAALIELAPSGVEQVDGDGWVEYGVRVRVTGRRWPGTGPSAGGASTCRCWWAAG